jgi:hypothetical protein
MPCGGFKKKVQFFFHFQKLASVSGALKTEILQLHHSSMYPYKLVILIKTILDIVRFSSGYSLLCKTLADTQDRTGDLFITSEMRCHCAMPAH